MFVLVHVCPTTKLYGRFHLFMLYVVLWTLHEKKLSLYLIGTIPTGQLLFSLNLYNFLDITFRDNLNNPYNLS